MGSTSLKDFYLTVYEPLKLRGKSKSTKHQYLVQIRHLKRFLLHEPTFADLTDESMSRFLSWFRDKRGRSAATVNKARNHLLALWRLAARRGVVAAYPDVPPEIEPERVPQAWLQEELQRLFSACLEEQGSLAGVPAGKWWRTLHLCAWDTAERKSALLSLKWANADLARGWLLIPAECRKGKRRDKAFQLHPDTVVALREILEPRRELIFPWPYHANYLYPRYKMILSRAKLPCDRKHLFHCMRKSTASYFEAAGGNATALLDHSSRSVTEAYLDPRIVNGQQASKLLFRPDKPPQSS